MTRRPAAMHHPKRRMCVLAESLSDRFGVALLAGDAEAADGLVRRADLN